MLGLPSRAVTVRTAVVFFLISINFLLGKYVMAKQVIEPPSYGSWIRADPHNSVVAERNLRFSTPENREEKVNAIWNSGEGMVNGNYYWEFHLVVEDPVRTAAFVGITTIPKLKSGYLLRGFLYGGNLSNGSSLLVSNYGDFLYDSSKIGMLVKVGSERTLVYFYLAGRCLGLAFDVRTDAANPFYPVISVSGVGAVSVTQSSTIPSQTDYQPETLSAFEGDWRLSRFGSGISLPSNNVGLSVKKLPDGEDYNLMVRGVNSHRFHVRTAGRFTVTPGASTLMGGLPELLKLDEDVCALIRAASDMTTENGMLKIKSRRDYILWTPAARESKTYTEH